MNYPPTLKSWLLHHFCIIILHSFLVFSSIFLMVILTLLFYLTLLSIISWLVFMVWSAQVQYCPLLLPNIVISQFFAKLIFSIYNIMTALESLTGLDRGHPLRGMELRAGHTCIISCAQHVNKWKLVTTNGKRHRDLEVQRTEMFHKWWVTWEICRKLKETMQVSSSHCIYTSI